MGWEPRQPLFYQSLTLKSSRGQYAAWLERLDIEAARQRRKNAGSEGLGTRVPFLRCQTGLGGRVFPGSPPGLLSPILLRTSTALLRPETLPEVEFLVFSTPG